MSRQIAILFELMPATEPEEVRLRQLLKHALRSLNLKCVDFWEVREDVAAESAVAVEDEAKA